MIDRNKNVSCLSPKDKKLGCCRVESIISIDERGQMVLPKEIREKAAISAGDKLAAISWEKDGKVCCISLIKAEDFEEMVKGLLSPLMQDIMAK
ncbi:MAG: HgcAB-associated protein HgcC [bacterium]